MRKCIYCDSHETENEVNFLNKCTFFTNECKLLYSKCSKYIHDIYIMNHNVAFIHIMTSTEPSVILATAKYLLLFLTIVCKSIYDIYYLNYKS